MILTLEQQVCTLESAKRLKELGFPQDSLWYWSDWSNNSSKGQIDKVIRLREGHPLFYKAHYSYFWEEDLCSAFNCSELGEMLPTTIDNKYGDCTMWLNLMGRNMHHSNGVHEYIVWYENGRKEETILFNKSTEVEARALMLIHLAESGLIEGRK